MSVWTTLNLVTFGVGAAVGAGATAAITLSQRKPDSLAAPVAAPIVDIERKNRPQIVSNLEVLQHSSAVLKYGHPGPVLDMLIRKAYTASYDRRLRHPSWTAEHLTLASLGKSRVVETIPDEGKGKGDRSRSNFSEDESIPVPFRARLADYFRSGYDRGHMVPAADCKSSQEAMDETFLLSNIAPQVGDGFNRHYWAYLEDWCRRQTSTFADVYVFTVPLYLPKQEADGKWRVTHEVIGSPVPNIAVPTHFAKVVFGARPSSPNTPTIQELSLGAFVLPNAPIADETPLTSFAVPVEAVERAAGLTLFSDAVKKSSKQICQTSKCELIIRRFDDVQRQGQKSIAAPKR
ncbi:nuclease [Tulasnella sp. JGI-2019a]|nr:nuclease [Tulasnella sp. JGI-2019a]